MAILGFVGGIISTAKDVAGVVTGATSNPEDANRRAWADRLYTEAVAGNAKSLRQLSCLAGEQTHAAEFGATAPPGCGFATSAARSYAAGRLAAARAAIAAQGAATTVVTDYVNPALNTAGYQIVPKWDGSTLLLIGVGLIGAYMVFKGGR